MNVHVSILDKLTRIDGGRWVPVYSDTTTNYKLQLTKSGWYYMTDSGGKLGGWNGKDVYAADAERHIREQAWKAVREWCWNKDKPIGHDLTIRDYGVSRSGVSLFWGQPFDGNLLSTGSDDAHALEAALGHILEAK